MCQLYLYTGGKKRDWEGIFSREENLTNFWKPTENLKAGRSLCLLLARLCLG